MDKKNNRNACKMPELSKAILWKKGKNMNEEHKKKELEEKKRTEHEWMNTKEELKLKQMMVKYEENSYRERV